MLSCLDGSNSSFTKCHITLVPPTDTDTSLALMGLSLLTVFHSSTRVFLENLKIFMESLEGNKKEISY